ncbi:hypothetical protein Taro_052035 [Colocasia esculenta]|uniref:CTLH domain-containing protein n=1 Tax=Colocasia esculenta TaxID=4460 RepID=A0A843XIS9_COLES|nr:hypothetical protein [Colocasia esculenta]
MGSWGFRVILARPLVLEGRFVRGGAGVRGFWSLVCFALASLLFWAFSFATVERLLIRSRRELVFLILQFLDEEKFKETIHKLEQESGFFFNMKHFEDLVQAGEWDELEKYLGGFTKVEGNLHSMRIFFEIRKQKYLEALDMCLAQVDGTTLRNGQEVVVKVQHEGIKQVILEVSTS